MRGAARRARLHWRLLFPNGAVRERKAFRVGHNHVSVVREGVMKLFVAVVCAFLVTACGDKVPESKAAKELGNVPKQTMDKAVTGVEAGMAQGAERNKEADEKK